MTQINHNRINNFELAAINKTIEVLEAYKAGKRVEYHTDINGWVKCHTPPLITPLEIERYRIVENDKIE